MKPRLIIKKTGGMVSVQDLGRIGYRRYGVPRSGALHPPFASLANALVGNPGDVAVLEFFQSGPSFHLEKGWVRLAITGDCRLTQIRHGKRQIFRSWRSVTLQAGDTLQVGSIYAGRVGYVAVEGGFDLDPVLGSCSTYLRGEFGGIDGSLLRSGTALPIFKKNAPKKNYFLPSPPNLNIPGSKPNASARFSPHPVRVILGPQDDYFTPDAIQEFLDCTYTVSSESDRMGSRLEGPSVQHHPEKKPEIISDSMVPGAIQVPGNGLPIVMLADGPTVGGYPKIATVISADLPTFATLPAGAQLSFVAVSLEEAEALLDESRKQLDAQIASIKVMPSISEPFQSLS